MSWTNDDGIISKEEAIAKFKADSTAAGYVDYKVFYDGNQVVRPSDLPERVDYSKISISAVMDQA